MRLSEIQTLASGPDALLTGQRGKEETRKLVNLSIG